MPRARACGPRTAITSASSGAATVVEHAGRVAAQRRGEELGPPRDPEVGQEQPGQRARQRRPAREQHAAEREGRDADQIGRRIRERPAARERLVDRDLGGEHQQDRAERDRHARAAQGACAAAAQQEAAERDHEEREGERARERRRERRRHEQPRPVALCSEQREQAERRAERERVLAGRQQRRCRDREQQRRPARGPAPLVHHDQGEEA